MAIDILSPGEAEFLKLTEEISRQCVDISEEQLVTLLPLLRDSLTAEMTPEKGASAAALLAERVVTTIFRRRQEILAPIVN